MEAILKPITNSLGNACFGLSNACASASSFIDTIQPNGYPSVFAPWGIGNSCGWGWGGFGWGGWGLGGWGLGCSHWGCNTFVPTLSTNPLLLSHHHSPFLGVYTDNNGFNPGMLSTPTPQVITSNESTIPSFGPTPTYSIMQENPFALPIFGASNEALRMMGYNVPVTQAPDLSSMLSTPTTTQPGQLLGGTSQQTQQTQQTQSVPFTTVQTQSGITPEHFLYPERFKPKNQTEEKPKQSEKEAAAAEAVAENAENIGEDLPEYYYSLANKKAKGERLSEKQNKIYRMYQNIIKNSPFEKDENGKIIQDNNGFIRNKLYKKMIELHSYLTTNDSDAAEKLIKRLKPEELAAIEFYWEGLPNASGEGKLNEKPLRAMLKDACMTDFLWMHKMFNYNTDKFEELSDYIDKTTSEISPRSMAYSFIQYADNCHQWGIGIDRDRVINMLNKLKGNPELADAVCQEYTKLRPGDTLLSLIGSKWFVFKNSETYQLAKEVLISSND